MKKALYLIVPVLICLLAGFLGSLSQRESLETWYPYLAKPPLTPPDSVFPIAWTLLYVCMGISVGLILLSDSPRKKPLAVLFSVQLLLNFLWTFLFFYLRNPLAGLIDILLLDLLVFLYAWESYPVKKASSVLFWPYLAWILFATYLNGSIFLYN